MSNESEKKTKNLKQIIYGLFLIFTLFITFISGLVIGIGFVGWAFVENAPIIIQQDIAFSFPQECPENKTDVGMIYPYYIYDSVFFPIYLCNLQPFGIYSLELFANGELLDIRNITLFNTTNHQFIFQADYNLKENDWVVIKLFDENYAFLATGITLFLELGGT